MRSDFRFAEAEEKGGEDARVDIMFDRLMLTDLRENVNKLDNNVFAELKNYKVSRPIQICLQII